jgi:hypothetical protein
MAIYIGSNTVANIIITNNVGTPIPIQKLFYSNLSSVPIELPLIIDNSLPTTPQPTSSATPILYVSSTPQPTNTATPSSTPQPTNTATPSSTPQPTNTATPSSTPQPTNTPTQSGVFIDNSDDIQTALVYATLDLTYIDNFNVFDIIL